MKGKTFKFRDPLSYPQVTVSEIHKQVQGVWLEPSGEQTTRLRVPPSFHTCPSGRTIFPSLFTRPPVVYPPAFALSLKNATLTGYRTVLSNEGYFCMDQSYIDTSSKDGAINRLAKPDAFNNEETGLVRIDDDGNFRFEVRERQIIEYTGTAALLCSTEPSNYGSFLFRILPKLHTLRSAQLNCKIIVPAYAQTMLELLALCGFDETRIVRHYADAIYKLEHAVVLSLRNSQAYLDQQSLNFFSELRASFGVPSQGRHLYITRQNVGIKSNAARSRLMRNEEEVICAMQHNDFEVVEPSSLSAIEQIRLFSSAELIVGPSGSALFNTVFCHPGTKLIDIESEPHWIHAHMCLFGSLGLDYGIFEATADDQDLNTVHKPFVVDVDALINTIREFEHAPMPIFLN